VFSPCTEHALAALMLPRGVSVYAGQDTWMHTRTMNVH